jgi:RNA polymerase sigma-70 factor (ECF subfamily)
MAKVLHELEDDHQFILNELRNGNERAFDIIFSKYYSSLTRFSFSFFKDQDKAESLVQEVFIKLWEKRTTLSEIDNLFSYLMIMVRNQSIDHLRKEKSKLKLHQNLKQEESVNTTEEQLSMNEFEEKLLQSIHRLPERCRIAFEMSRFDGYTNKEIAENMQISVKGVEALIGRSLKFLREELKEFLPSVVFGGNKRGAVLFSMLIRSFDRMALNSVRSLV